jgi:flagellar biosynthetic protein FlhB
MSDQLRQLIDELWRKKPQEIATVEATMALAKLSLWFFFNSLWPLLLVALVLSIMIPFFQVGAIFAPNQLTVNPDRINPLQGFKKIFSFKSVVELTKSILKMSLMLAVLYAFSSQIITEMKGFFNLSLESFLEVALWSYMKVAAALLFTFFVLALIDLSYEKFSFFQKMKMTKKELKEELKEREGNPEIRSKIKSLQREMARKKMFKELF